MRLSRWETQGPLLIGDGSVSWLGHFTGAAAASYHEDDGCLEVFVSGRDARNRSHIGRVWFDLHRPGAAPVIDPDPVLAPGDLGAFDENGVSYPCLVTVSDTRYLFYTGWMPTVLTPFQNHIGLAVEGADGRFERASRAPVLPRNDADYLSMGSSFCLVESGIWRLWYTSWTSWGQCGCEPRHRYVIKHATSNDGMTWHRDNVLCVGPSSEHEHSICRPSVLRLDDEYHMWFCSRGDHYRIHHAVSSDGLAWERDDRGARFATSSHQFDSLERSYPHVLRVDDRLLMLYSGNGYGRAGLGLATMRLD